jgi:hypothetical protein
LAELVVCYSNSNSNNNWKTEREEVLRFR